MNAPVSHLALVPNQIAGPAPPAWHHFAVPIFGAKATQTGSSKDYTTATLVDLFTMAPGESPKSEAMGFIPSTYCAPDARNHQAQRERGRFVALTADIDDGDQPLVTARARGCARGLAKACEPVR